MLNGFVIEYDGKLRSSYKDFINMGSTTETSGAVQKKIRIHKSIVNDLEVKNTVVTYKDLNIIEKWIEVKNVSCKDMKITRIDSIEGDIPADKYMLKYFTSEWGREFTPKDIKLEEAKILEVTSGRSSFGVHPWFSLTGEGGNILTCAAAWSGNWIVRFEPLEEGNYRITGGLSNWEFSKTLKPEEAMDGIKFVYSYFEKGDIADTSLEFGKWNKRYNMPHNSIADKMLVEWNHWWPYEDFKLDEEIIKKNADECTKLGIDVCTLDSGWFGPHSDTSNWWKVRGDWHNVNLRRFPSGIRALSDYIHNKGLKFGIWCEIEAAAEEAELNIKHPEFIAKRDGENLGYVCMANPEAREWAFGILEMLIKDYGADWIKLDFNLNPGAGCNRCDHGHEAGDGLYEHYRGYYKLLDKVREKYPEVILESCASGGLRIDLGLLGHTHKAHLSDPDYTLHHLQTFWGAAAMLHPSQCLHFTWSQIMGDHNVISEPIIEDMPKYKFDYIIRAGMLGSLGFSYRLSEFPNWCKERLRELIEFYKSISVKFIRNGDMYLLTNQAQRNGKGDSWNGFLYITEDKNEASLFAFRLLGSKSERSFKLRGLNEDYTYMISYQDSELSYEKSGKELLETGIDIKLQHEESSEIIFLKRR